MQSFSNGGRNGRDQRLPALRARSRTCAVPAAASAGDDDPVQKAIANAVRADAKHAKHLQRKLKADAARAKAHATADAEYAPTQRVVMMVSLCVLVFYTPNA